VKVTGDILDVLGSASPDGNLLYLNERLGPALYQQVDAALQTAGGRWDKQLKAHVFPGNAWAAVLDLTAHDEVITEREARQADGWFATPAEVTRRLLELAGPQPSMRALEPSAGEGAIAIPLAGRVGQVDAIEVHAGRASELARAGAHIRVLCADFLRCPPGRPGRDYDLVVMNPPFGRGTEVRHVTHALRFLRRGGRLVAVMPASAPDRRDKATAALRRVIDQRGGWYEPLPAESFRESGTDFATVIAIIPGSLRAAAGAPVRVTCDQTATGVPLFSPVTSAPGVYVRYDPWTGRDRVFRHTGACTGCGAPTWRHDDGDDNVRGCFGDYLGVPITAADLGGHDVPPGATFARCAACRQDGARSERALIRARARLAQGPLPAGGQQLELFEAAA
jgi:predicted RNA methylase